MYGIPNDLDDPTVDSTTPDDIGKESICSLESSYSSCLKENTSFEGERCKEKDVKFAGCLCDASLRFILRQNPSSICCHEVLKASNGCQMATIYSPASPRLVRNAKPPMYKSTEREYPRDPNTTATSTGSNHGGVRPGDFLVSVMSWHMQARMKTPNSSA